MKIAIDISQVIYETGVSTYVRNLVTSLLSVDNVNDYILFGGSIRRRADLNRFVKSLSGNFRSEVNCISPTIGAFLWNTLRVFPLERITGKVDIAHISDWTVPPTSAKIVTTIHDLVPVKYPDLTDTKIVSNFERYIKLVKKYANAVITPSQATKKDLIEYGFNRDIIYVIPEAVDPLIRKKLPEDVESYKQSHSLPKKYILAVGVTSRKNIKGILSSFSLLGDKYDKLSLVIIGNNYSKEKIPKNVVFLGHVANSDLAYLYCGSELLLYPSFYEGFGLPIIEAFSCGTPVVTSNIGSMKELGENAAELVDPDNVNDILRGINMVLDHRNIYINKGYDRAKNYSWDDTARKTINIYTKTI